VWVSTWIWAFSQSTSSPFIQIFGVGVMGMMVLQRVGWVLTGLGSRMVVAVWGSRMRCCYDTAAATASPISVVEPL
ncbi:MAG: hypothetical protein KC470_00975, partial [Dehalococcoidia bacterium]|nr:hypothetical protein [Dehalococcoidia bacterium]